MMSIKSDAIAMIVNECRLQKIYKPEAIQYILATVEHETNGTFRPVREAYWVRNKMIRKYGQREGEKRFDTWAKRTFKYFPYQGRGLVQITWRKNYEKFIPLLQRRFRDNSIDLINNPDDALKLNYSIFILVYGMKHGLFTSKKLDDYFSSDGSDFIGARKIINGTDKANKIALLASKYKIDI